MTAAAAQDAGPQLGPTEVKRLNRSWRQQAQARIGLLLDSVSQPFNVGSIIRTAAAFGVEQVWLCGDTAPPEHPAGPQDRPGHRPPGHVRARARQRPRPWPPRRAAGLRVIAIELAEDAVPLHEAPLGDDVCLALGNEDRGCSPALLAAADVIAYIPQLGRVGSLNVAAAAAIALAETRRREWQRG